MRVATAAFVGRAKKRKESKLVVVSKGFPGINVKTLKISVVMTNVKMEGNVCKFEYFYPSV